MLKILYVAQTYHPKIGGAERYMDRLATVMSTRGHTVYVLAPETDVSELERDYKVIRTSFYEKYKKGVLYFLRAIPMGRKIKKIVCEKDIEVLHFQYLNPFTATIKYLKSSSAKVYGTIHGSGVHFMQEDWLGKRILKHVLKRIDGVAPVSDYCAGLAKKWGADPKKVHVIYNGTDPEIFTPVKDSEHVEHHTILTACRLVPRKDITTLLKAFKIVKNSVGDARLKVAGDGPDRARLKKLAKKMGLANEVKFLGFVSDDDLCKLYRSTGVFVLPAKYDPAGRDIEGFGIALLEAMASSRPVIGAKVGGIPSAIKSDWGFLYKPEDWEELSERIIYLMKHRKSADNIGKKGRKAVENIYNWNHVAKSLEVMYGSG